MTAILNPPTTSDAERITLTKISWETYESLLTDLADQSVPRLTYDGGTLEIMSPNNKHEECNRAIARLVEVLAEEMGVEVRDLGSTTFRRNDIKRGFEPDTCFYVQNEAIIRGKKNLDPNIDPPPDLVIEVDITSPSLERFPIFAAFGVPEVWRFDGERLEIFLLSEGTYAKSEKSKALPFVVPEALVGFVAESVSLGRLEWLRKVREWARSQKEGKRAE
ncbi:MAG TPA: Uma2 family endonuclease [Pyrinomonadaceae bacterium]|nr:Uma2 family endonuclease [Pyrinomonadaceae bacterium]